MEISQHVEGNGADPTNGVTPTTVAEIVPDPELDSSVPQEVYEQLVHYMNSRYAIVIDNQLGSKPVILGFPRNIDNPEDTYGLLSESAVILHVKNRRLKDRRGYSHDWYWWWSRSRSRRVVWGVVFKPGEPQMVRGAYNMGYPLFAVEPKSGEGHLPYLDHIRGVICGGRELWFENVINSMAHTVQNPQARTSNICLCIRGTRGSGKGTFVDIFGRLFGRHYLYVNDMRRVTKQFNAQLADKIFVFLDEGFWGSGGNAVIAHKTMETLITERVFPVEYKGRETIQLDNYLHFMLGTTEAWSAPISLDERRFVPVKTADTYVRDREHFKAIYNGLDNGGLSHLLNYLQNWRITEDFSFQSFPQDAEFAAQMRLGFKTEEEWYCQVLEEGENGGVVPSALVEGWESGPIHSPAALWYDAYLRYCDSQRVKPLAPNTLLTHLEKLLPEEFVSKNATWEWGPIVTFREMRLPEGKKQVKCWHFPELRKTRAQFTKGASVEFH